MRPPQPPGKCWVSHLAPPSFFQVPKRLTEPPREAGGAEEEAEVRTAARGVAARRPADPHSPQLPQAAGRPAREWEAFESLEEEAARDYEASRRRAEATATPPARDGAQGEGGGGAGATSPGPTTSVATSLDAAAETEAATASTPNFFASTKCVGPQARNSCGHACWRLFTVASVSCTRGGAA